MEEVLPDAVIQPLVEKEDIGKGQGDASKTQGILSGAHKIRHADGAVLEGDTIGANFLSMAKDG